MTFANESSRDCAQAWEAMPWVLQDSASTEQSDWLMSHLARCAGCSAEFAQQSRLRQALQLPTDVALDANVGLKRLLTRLDMPEPQALPERRRAGGWVTRLLAAAVLVQAIGLGALGTRLWSENEHAAYHTLSSPDATPVAPGAIHVVPDPTMKLTDWNALLRSLHLQVVGGPNEVGAYTVVPVGPPTVAAQALQQLRGNQGVRMAEPVSGTP
ncbi:zf-HC2 domain-containing protein [Dyella sp.]|uniref:zf-HC2 domain-containing protein n=1 Tax=Dyella sp. TaxID=1869338 RepID=UPI002ED503DB